jgi:hypothetical protein
MNTSFVLQRRSDLHLATLICASGLAIGSFLVWRACLERQPAPIGIGLRLAAIGLVVMWTHFLVWLSRKMSARAISVGYCTLLFFGASAVFFLIYNCLL